MFEFEVLLPFFEKDNAEYFSEHFHQLSIRHVLLLLILLFNNFLLFHIRFQLIRFNSRLTVRHQVICKITRVFNRHYFFKEHLSMFLHPVRVAQVLYVDVSSRHLELRSQILKYDFQWLLRPSVYLHQVVRGRRSCHFLRLLQTRLELKFQRVVFLLSKCVLRGHLLLVHYVHNHGLLLLDHAQ